MFFIVCVSISCIQTLSFLLPPYSGLEPQIRSYFSFLSCVVIKELTYHQAVQKPMHVDAKCA